MTPLADQNDARASGNAIANALYYLWITDYREGASKSDVDFSYYMQDVDDIHHYLEVEDAECVYIPALINYYQTIFSSMASLNPSSPRFLEMQAFNNEYSESYRYLLATYLVLATTTDIPYFKEVWTGLAGKSFSTFNADVFTFWGFTNCVPIHLLIS